MISTEMLNDWAQVWGSLAARSLVDASLLLVIVGVVWLAFRRRMSGQLGYCLLLLVPAKLLVPIEIPVPAWVTRASPEHTAERIVARTRLLPARPASGDFVRPQSRQPNVGADLPGHRFDLAQPSGQETGYVQRSMSSPSSSVAAALSDVALRSSGGTEEPLLVLSTRAKLMIAWSVIVLGMVAFFVCTQWRLIGVLRRAESVEPRTLPVDFGHLKRLAGVRRSIRLLASPVVSSPAVHGLVRPSLLLPPDFVESVSPAQMRFVLLHELAHVQRGDLWVAAFQRLVQIVYFFNPAVWIANWLIDRQREYACDDVALATGGVSRRESGEAFVRIVERANSRKPSLDPALGIFNSKHFFRRRLMRILDTNRRIRPKLTFGSAVLLAAMATILLPHVRAIQEQVDNNGPAVTKTDTGADANKTEKEPTGEPSETPGILVSAFGRVVDSDGKPMPGVAVHVRDWPTERVDADWWGPPQRDVLATTQTDEEGNFRFDDVPVPPFEPGIRFDVPCDVVAVAEGYAMAWEHLAAATNREPVNLTLVPESQVSGSIVDEQGEPIEGAFVKAIFISPLGGDHVAGNLAGHLSLYISQSAAAAKSDADGRVSIDRLPPDKWIVLAVDHDDYRNEYVHVATTDTAQPDITFRRRHENRSTPQEVHSNNFALTMEPRGPRLGGRITLADGGIPHAHASVFLDGTGNSLWDKTDEDGRYAFKDTMRAEYRVTVFAPKDTDHLTRQFRLTLPEDGSDMKLDIELPVGQIVTGSVVDEDTDEGIPGVLVSSVPSWGKESNGYLGRRGHTDDRGNFRVAVPPGKSMLQISSPGNDYHITRGSRGEQPDARFVRMIEVTEGKAPGDVRFWLSRGLVINGLVSDADGKPVDGATVKTVFRNSDDPFRKKETQTDEQGRFTTSGFPADSRQYIEVTHEERALYGEITVDADKKALSPRIVSVEAKLAPAAVVKGRVMVDGEPGDGVHVDLLRDVAGRQGFVATLATAIADATGRYAFNVAPTGEKLRVMVGDEFGSQLTECESDEFVLEPGQVLEPTTLAVRRKNATISGIVVDSDGNPIEGVSVSALPRSGKEKIGSATQTPTGKDGRFTIWAVPNGPLKLRASKRNPGSPTDRSSYSYARVETNGGADDVRIVFQPEAE